MKYTSGIAATGSGSFGGVTASHNRGGQYFRRRAIPTDPFTAAQKAIRGYFASIATAWSQTLTAAQRTGWETYALNTPVLDPLGQQVNAGGKGMYTRGNVPRLLATIARVDAPPTTFGFPAMTNPTVVSLTAATSVISVGFANTDTWATAVGGALLVFISRPVSAALNFYRGPFRFVNKIAGAVTPPASPQPVTSPFTYVAGQHGFVRFVAITPDGRLSNDFVVPVTAI